MSNTPSPAAPAKEDDQSKYLNVNERAKLVAAVKSTSLEDVCKKSHASEMSLAKAAAGFPVQRGTIALIQKYLNA